MHNKFPDVITREVQDRVRLSPAAYVDAPDPIPGNFPAAEQVVAYITAGKYAPAASPAAFSVLLVKADQDGIPMSPALIFTGHSSAFATDQRMVLLGTGMSQSSEGLRPSSDSHKVG